MKRKISNLLLTGLFFAITLTGCGSNNQTEKDNVEKTENVAEKNEATQEDNSDNLSMMFNGSSTLAPVISTIAADFNEKYTSWDKVDPSLPEKDITIYVSSGGSGQGVKSVIDKTSNFGMVSREVKDTEKEKIEDYKEEKIGIDALTIAINPENPAAAKIDSLSKDQIASIFSGEYKTWKDLDPSLQDDEILVITRDVNGGAHEVFQKNIMGDKNVKQEAIQAASMGELVKNIIDNPNAIGYASYGLVNQNEGKLYTIAVDGVEANKENIVNGSYIIQRPLLIIYSGEPSPQAKHFLDLLMSDEGQSKIEEMGFIPVN